MSWLVWASWSCLASPWNLLVVRSNLLVSAPLAVDWAPASMESSFSSKKTLDMVAPQMASSSRVFRFACRKGLAWFFLVLAPSVAGLGGA